MISAAFVAIAFIGGLLTFFAPCIAPLMPGYLSFIAGTSMHDDSKRARRTAVLTSLAFVAGLALVFSLMGAVLTVFLAGASASIARVLEVVGGVLIITFGILMSGLVKLPWLEREFKFHPHKGRYRYPSAFLFGAAFGIGWTPCVGAILGAILTLAVVEPGSAFALLFAFSLGIGVPFVVLSLFVGPMTAFIKRSKRAFAIVNIIASLILIVLGLLLVTGQFAHIASYQMSLGNADWANDLQDRLVNWLIESNEPAREAVKTANCDPTITDCLPNP